MNGASTPLPQLYKTGHFPGRIAPWAEDDLFFHPIHNRMIGLLLEQLSDTLFAMGYIVGTETSLQIAEGCIPDVFVLRGDLPRQHPRLDYELAAREMLAEPGEPVTESPDLDALHIHDAKTGDLVTVVEIVSPGNKINAQDIFAYQECRSRLFLEKGVNVVEVDMTRSNKRLVHHIRTQQSPYHVAIFLAGIGLRIVSIPLESSLSRIALPLRGEVTAMELQPAYQNAYQQLTTAWHIQHKTGYAESALPFSSLLTDIQRQNALKAVKTWQKQLATE